MRIPRRSERTQPTGSFAAAEDAARRLEEAVPQLDRATGADWYEPGGEADLAALTLCRLRRARAGEKGGPQHGDEAVRSALAQANPEAVLWIASRAISYMDENGFPQAVELWFPEETAS